MRKIFLFAKIDIDRKYFIKFKEMQNQNNLIQIKKMNKLMLKRARWKETDWSIDEVEKLKNEFLSGKRIKTIASEMSRSETAINKFLSRAGIRRPKLTKNSIRFKKQKNKKNFELSECVRNKVYKNEQKSSLDDVIKYMKSLGYKISKNTSTQSMFYINEEYMINHKPISKIKLLLIANKLRSEENKPIFKLDEINW